MKKLLLFTTLILNPHALFAQVQVTHGALIGVWSYFYIGADFFAKDMMLATEQRLIFQDGQNVVLEILAKEKEYNQDTSYKLKYSLSLKDNVPYITLFSTESKEVLGAYMRMPLGDSLEMAADPNFKTKKQLYQRKSPQITGK